MVVMAPYIANREQVQSVLENGGLMTQLIKNA